VTCALMISSRSPKRSVAPRGPLLLPERPISSSRRWCSAVELGVVAGREPVQDVSPPAREPVDLLLDLVQAAHAYQNDLPLPGIPPTKT